MANDLLALNCPHCGQAVSVPSTAAGLAVACPHCRVQFQVPTRAMPFGGPPVPPPLPAARGQTVRCGRCGLEMEAPAGVAGQTLSCPSCGWQFSIGAQPVGGSGMQTSKLPPGAGEPFSGSSYYHPQVAPQFGTQPKSNGLAVGGFVVSLIGLVLSCIPCPCVWFVGIVMDIIGLILSAVGASVSGRRGGAGKGLAVAGIVLGLIGLCIWIIWAAMVGSMVHGMGRAFDELK